MANAFYKQDYRIFIFTGDEMFDEDFVSTIDSQPTYSRSAHELEQLKSRSKAMAAAKEYAQTQEQANKQDTEIVNN